MPILINYLESIRPALCLVILAALGTILTLAFKKLISTRTAHATLIALSLISTFQFIDFGRLIGGRHFHASEFYHYYLNGKYFGDLGYTNLYVGWATALQEINGTQVPLIRELTAKKSFLTPQQYNILGQKLKAKMGPIKWNQFKGDLQQLMAYEECDWNIALGDAGYNASPSWALESQLVTRGPPNPSLLTKIDIGLLLLSLIILGTTFGWLPTLAGLIIMTCLPAGWLNDYNWTGGSLLRFTWVFYLSVGIVCYHRKWLFLSGVALGLATLERLFPGGFLIALGIYQFTNSLQDAKFNIVTAVKRTSPLVAGATVTAVCIIGITELMWHGCWFEFLNHIFRHKDLMFTNSFGWTKACSFYPGMEQINFAQTNDNIFQGMSDYLQTRAHLTSFLVLKYLSLGLLLTALTKTKPAHAGMIAGFAIIFFFAIPAQYYLTMLLPISAVLLFHTKESLFASSFCLAIMVGTLLVQVSDITGFVLLSIWFYLILMFYAGYLLLKNNPTLGGILSLTIFGSLFFILACPHNKLIPPTKFSTALAANINLVAITTERTYPDPYGAIVTDYGRALKQGTPCSITNPQPNTHKKCLLIIRTDRFFDGVLTISSQQNILAKAVVAKRGYLFDYIVIPVSWYPSYDLTWQGGGNIGIFQCWVN